MKKILSLFLVLSFILGYQYDFINADYPSVEAVKEEENEDEEKGIHENQEEENKIPNEESGETEGEILDKYDIIPVDEIPLNIINLKTNGDNINNDLVVDNDTWISKFKNPKEETINIHLGNNIIVHESIELPTNVKNINIYSNNYNIEVDSSTTLIKISNNDDLIINLDGTNISGIVGGSNNQLFELNDSNVRIDGSNSHIYNFNPWDKGVINGENGNLDINNMIFSDNKSSNRGRVINIDKFENFNISDSQFYNNESKGVGSCIYFNTNESSALTKINNCIFEENNGGESPGEGGAISGFGGDLNIINTDFLNNTTLESGGALAFSNGTIYIDNSNFTGNIGYINYGGAILLYGDTTGHIKSSNFSNNKAIPYNNISRHISCGGAIALIRMNQDILMEDNVFSNNMAKKDGGAIYLSINNNTNSNLELIGNNLFTGNMGYNGGGIFSYGQINISGNPIFDSNKGESEGGAINLFNNGKIENATFINNTASKSGGAIFSVSKEIKDNSKLEINSGIFEKNNASFGGAIAIGPNPSCLEVNGDCKFIENSAYSYGGAIDFELSGPNTFFNFDDLLGNYLVAIGKDVVFRDNTLKLDNREHRLDQKDLDYYEEKVKTQSFSKDNNGNPFYYGFNNYDIGRYRGKDNYSLYYNDEKAIIENMDQLNSPLNYPSGKIEVLKYPEYNKKAYKFIGWKIDDEYITEVEFTDHNIIVEADFEEEKYKISYDANGGIGLVEDNNLYNYEENIVIKSGKELKKEGYEFIGWKTINDDNNYNENDNYIIKEDTIFIAQWINPYIYKIIYDTNGGIGDIKDNNLYKSGDTIILKSGENLSKKDHKFIAWEENGISYNEDSSLKIYNDRKFVAKWKYIEKDTNNRIDNNSESNNNQRENPEIKISKTIDLSDKSKDIIIPENKINEKTDETEKFEIIHLEKEDIPLCKEEIKDEEKENIKNNPKTGTLYKSPYLAMVLGFVYIFIIILKRKNLLK